MTTNLKDNFGRKVEYLRVSITDRCNLQCTYCMPAGGVELAPRCEIMQYRDFLRLIEIFARIGVRKVRVTGGEPLVRKGIVGFLKQLGEIDGIEEIAITTNGVLLDRMAASIREAGVVRVNISLDSLRQERFHEITRSNEFDKTMRGIDAALAAGFDSVKLNMVVMRGVNDDELEDFARLTIDKAIQVRFIEFMPATTGLWDEKNVYPMDEIKKRIEKLGKLDPCDKKKWGGPARIYQLDGAAGEIGFISAISHNFCSDCNRMRLTSKGGMMMCLFGEAQLDLHKMIIDGATDEEINAAIVKALSSKNEVGQILEADGLCRPTMSAVGG